MQRVYLWPDSVPPIPLFVSTQVPGALPRWAWFLPEWVRRGVLHRRMGIAGQPDDSYMSLAVLSNCAPYLLRALKERHWQAIVLIQTSMAPWLEYLPDVGAKVMYFHDVRSDYFRRSTDPRIAKMAHLVHHQEQQASDNVDAVGFVSELDLTRAERLLRLPSARHVAPIPVDTGYFTPRPGDWKKDPRKIVLFTGHLAQHRRRAVFSRGGVAAGSRRVSRRRLSSGRPYSGPEESAAAAAAPQTELHANVPDIRPYFGNADAYVAPMRYGGGGGKNL